MRSSLLKIPSLIKRSQPKECAMIIGLNESCPIALTLLERAKRAGLVVYHVVHDSQMKGVAITPKNQPAQQDHQVRLDISSSDSVAQLFKKVADARLTPQWIIHYPERPAPMDTLRMTPYDLESLWRVQGLSAFIFGQAAVREMLKNSVNTNTVYSPTIIFLGAIDAVQSQSNFSGFSATKAGVRALAQSMAREFDPQGIHVAHVLLDHHNSVNEPFAQATATTCWQIYSQPKQAWTQELELRSS